MLAAPGFVDGLALAATLAGDRDGESVHRGLADDVGALLDARLGALRGLEGAARERALAAMMDGLRAPVDPESALPARAAAILASDVPRAIGSRWMSDAPLPRPGFRVTASLRAQLRRLATRPSGEHDARDRGEGRRLLCEACRGEDGIGHAEALAPLEPEEAAAVVALDAVLGEPGSDRARSIALARAAIAAGAGAELTRALGAMARAARDEAASDGGPWERAGRESALVWERACRA